ncbi:hypothetical protein JTB14_019558 [Gonioctena quinquepunctata]|nr:hypothetical protein JTB14_019558 [Gonioctena quinquepunctata]
MDRNLDLSIITSDDAYNLLEEIPSDGSDASKSEDVISDMDMVLDVLDEPDDISNGHDDIMDGQGDVHDGNKHMLASSQQKKGTPQKERTTYGMVISEGDKTFKDILTLVRAKITNNDSAEYIRSIWSTQKRKLS